jgi:hypothetical protein
LVSICAASPRLCGACGEMLTSVVVCAAPPKLPGEPMLECKQGAALQPDTLRSAIAGAVFSGSLVLSRLATTALLIYFVEDRGSCDGCCLEVRVCIIGLNQ